MSEDRREGQSKFDRPAASSGLAGPPAPPAPAQQDPSGPPAPVPAAVPSAPAGAFTPVTPAAPAAPRYDAEADEDLADEEDELPLSFVERLRRLSPAAVILTLGSIGSLAFLFLSVTSHTTPVAMLLSAAVVTGLVFGADAVIASAVTWRAGRSGETGRAFLAAIVGGVASMISLGAFAGTLVLILVLRT